jgi:hypothetical protein
MAGDEQQRRLLCYGSRSWGGEAAVEALRLRGVGYGDHRAAAMLNAAGHRVTRHWVRQVWMKSNAPGLAGSRGEHGLLRYETARAALAECRRVDEVLAIKNDAERLKLLARQAKDRELWADAAELTLRAKRQLGLLLAKAKEAGQVAVGRPQEKGSGENPFQGGSASTYRRVTLSEAGIDKRLANEARKAAAIPDDAFEIAVENLRSRVIAGRALVVEVQPAPINGARAIMAVEPNDSLDPFWTPPWATRALIEVVLPELGILPPSLKNETCWEPACGEGHMAEVLAEYFYTVRASDVFDYGHRGTIVEDFLADGNELRAFDWIVTNPPFADRSEQFAVKANSLAERGAALFVRLQWLETIGRYERLFAKYPPTLLAFFAERVNLCKGRWEPDGGTATAYMWIVWGRGEPPQPPFWIPPGCRETLTRSDDLERFTTHPVTQRRLQSCPTSSQRPLVVCEAEDQL